MITFPSKQTHPLIYTACIVLTAVGLLCSPELAFAQSATTTPPHVPLQKAIGQSKEAKPEVVPSLIVLNARGASLQGQKLTLVGVAQNSIVFADRPVRSAGHVLTAHLLEEWGTGSDSFAKDPNAGRRSVDIRCASPGGRFGGRRRSRFRFHRHYRHALDAAIVCRRRAPYRGSGGLVWRGRRAVLSSVLPAPGPVLSPRLRVLPVPALLLGMAENCRQTQPGRCSRVRLG